MTLDVHTPINPRTQSRGRKKQIKWRMVSLVLLAIVLAFWAGHATIKFFLDDSAQQGQGRDLTNVPSEVSRMEKKSKNKNKKSKKTKTTTAGATTSTTTAGATTSTTTAGATTSTSEDASCPTLTETFLLDIQPLAPNDHYLVSVQLESAADVVITGTVLSFSANVAGDSGTYVPLSDGSYPFSPDASCPDDPANPGSICGETCNGSQGPVTGGVPSSWCGWRFNTDFNNFPPCIDDRCFIKASLAFSYSDSGSTVSCSYLAESFILLSFT